MTTLTPPTIEPPATQRTHRRGGISPNKRLELLLCEYETDKLPAAFLGALLELHKKLDVTKDGIEFEHRHETYKFKHLESVLLTEQWIGKKVLVRFDPLAADVCYVFEIGNGRLIDVLPAKESVKWFDHAAAQRQLDAHRRHLARTEEHLRHIHKPDVKRALKSARKNSDAIQITNTFSVPAASAQPRKTEDQPILEAHDTRAGRRTNCPASEGPASRVGGMRVRPEPTHATRTRGSSFAPAEALSAVSAGMQRQREKYSRRVKSDKDLAALAESASLRLASRQTTTTQTRKEESHHDDNY